MNAYPLSKFNRSFQRLFNLLLALTLLVSALGFTAGQAQASSAAAFTCTEYHTVQKGEYLSMIARLYGVDWRWLAEINNLSNPSKIYPGQKLCVAGDGTPTVTPPATSGPQVTITKVIEDESVTIELRGYPANRDVEVLLGKIGTKGVNGTLAATLRTDKNGALKETVNIPKKLKDVSQIAIRVQTRGGGFYAYNWFTNANSNAGGSSSGAPSGKPEIEIVEVQTAYSVTIKGENFPADTKLFVYMGRYGSHGEGGTLVETVRTDNKGKFSKTFLVPEKLDAARRLDIRVQTRDNRYFAYDWFYNRTNP